MMRDERWEPDWRELSQALQDQDFRPYSHKVSAVIAEYRRQQAEQGKVEVDREDVIWMHDKSNVWCQLTTDEDIARYQRILAAT